ncbi:hypothetical protein [Deinococcus sp. YIM 77859]|uniref:hypothetical protein n=1 Tax=Deinococcus sp. YIM 77859 TaxID=1540221 RepID=UPI00054D925B|nr:hypothetical protein [Deinococcus sp. YIM 77859]
MTGPKKGSRGRPPKGNTAQGRGGSTRPVQAERTGSGAARGVHPARRQPGERPFAPSPARSAPPKAKKSAPPELKRVELSPPAADTVFHDRDGEPLTFPDSALRRVAARLLSEKKKAWRYRAFPFPLFTEKGHEQSFFFDFYVYDNQDSVIRLILVVPFESREVWDRVGRFKRQYPMYRYELWTPEKLGELQGPRGRLGF